jgi:LPS export ABC transporter protein LptC
MFEVSQSMNLKKVKMTFFDASGAERSKLVADSAIMYWSSGLIAARGSVALTAPDGRVLKSEALRIDDAAREISTDEAFTLTGGQEFVRGTSLKTDPEFKNVVASKPRGFSGKPMALPGQ